MEPVDEAQPVDESPILVRVDGDTVVVRHPEPPDPGGEVGLYVQEERPDPISGAMVSGWRFAGDGRVVWSAPGLVVVQLRVALGGGAGRAVRFGPARGASPTPAWVPPAPAAPPVVAVAERVVAAERERREPSTARRDAWSAARGDRTEGLRASLDWSDDGYGTGVGVGRLSWWTLPARGPGRFELGLEGLRGQRWVAATEGDEDPGREVAAAWLTTATLESRGARAGLIVGGAVGVDADGLGLGGTLGLRAGDDAGSRVTLTGTSVAGLGSRLALDGRARWSDRWATGLRARVGDLPRHDASEVRQARADGLVRVELDPVDAFGVSVGAGLAAYDLLWMDAGPVVDASVELRW